MPKASLLLILATLALAGADLKTEFLADVDNLEKKFTSLAEAMPAEKYSWRPGPGIRSVSEVLMHVAGANYMLPNMVGIAPPSGISRDMEKTVTDRAQVTDHLRKSFANLRKAAEPAAAEPDKAVKVFGREMSQRGFLTFLQTHLHEHLGQMIAYTRTQGVKVPWARE